MAHQFKKTSKSEARRLTCAWIASRQRQTRAGLGVLLAAALLFSAGAALAEAPKRGGILTYMIPADGGPSLDGHRETTFAVVHATAPFYSVLIRVDPNNPSSTIRTRFPMSIDPFRPPSMFFTAVLFGGLLCTVAGASSPLPRS